MLVWFNFSTVLFKCLSFAESGQRPVEVLFCALVCTLHICSSSVQGAMKVIGPSVDVRQSLEVPAIPIKMEGEEGEVEIQPPSTGIGFKPIPLLLMSHKWREGQEPVSIHTHTHTQTQ